MIRTDIFVVGAGAAGISAALSAWDNGCRRILIAERQSVPGGILTQCRHKGFGIRTFHKELTGPEYAKILTDKLNKSGIEYINATVLSVSTEKTAVISSRNGLETVEFEKIIIATGCREIPVESLMIPGTRPAGIYTAGQAQEMINIHHMDIGENIVILGCGNLGMIIANRIHAEGKKVVAVIEKNLRHGGMARNYHRCIEKNSIPVRYGSTISEIHGYPHITGVTLTNIDTGEEELIACDTLVSAIGFVPEISLIDGKEYPDWMRLCGNCSNIHDIVDSAVDEAKKIGKELSGKI